MRLDYPVALLCRVFDVSRSGFYAWLSRKPSPRRQADERLKVAIKAVHRQSRETWGVLSIICRSPAGHFLPLMKRLIHVAGSFAGIIDMIQTIQACTCAHLFAARA